MQIELLLKFYLVWFISRIPEIIFLVCFYWWAAEVYLRGESRSVPPPQIFHSTIKYYAVIWRDILATSWNEQQIKIHGVISQMNTSVVSQRTAVSKISAPPEIKGYEE
jgi:hypothetical protein